MCAFATHLLKCGRHGFQVVNPPRASALHLIRALPALLKGPRRRELGRWFLRRQPAPESLAAAAEDQSSTTSSIRVRSNQHPKPNPKLRLSVNLRLESDGGSKETWLGK